MERQKSFEEHLERLLQHTSVQGKRVLEIGGDRWRYVSKRFIEEGAEYVETINIVPGWPDGKFVFPKVFSRKLDCRCLSEVHASNSFDLIFGIAVAEHISGLPKFLLEADKILRPNGLLYLHGGPIWTATKGHHLWCLIGDKLYRFSDPDCPIRRWEHLMTDEAGLADRLKARGVPEDHARGIGRWVYETEDQNRCGYGDLCSHFNASPLKLLSRYDNAFHRPNAEELAAIAARGYHPDDRYEVSGVSHLMAKQ